MKEKEDLANQMAFYSLWQNENDIDLSLAEIQTKTEKRKALVVQLKFRKKFCSNNLLKVLYLTRHQQTKRL